MLKLFLFPGDVVCDLSGIAQASENRQVLRSFINTMVWGAFASGAAVWINF